MSEVILYTRNSGGNGGGARGGDELAQSLEPPWGRVSRLQRCSGSAATDQDLCKTVIATSKVNWATTLDCVLKLCTQP